MIEVWPYDLYACFFFLHQSAILEVLPQYVNDRNWIILKHTRMVGIISLSRRFPCISCMLSAIERIMSYRAVTTLIKHILSLKSGGAACHPSCEVGENPWLGGCLDFFLWDSVCFKIKSKREELRGLAIA